MNKNKIRFKLNLSVFFLIFFTTALFAQDRAIRGVVKDNHGEAIIGANVMVKGTAIGTATDLDGNYSMSVPSSATTLTVSYIGMRDVDVPIKGDVVNIVMEEDVASLDELIVIGYGTVKKRDLTGSVSSISSKDIVAAPVSNVAQALQGKLAGVNVVSQDGRPDASISIRVRGGGSISQSNDPLVLIDGIAGSLNDIPSEQVESIDVLKDASSTAIYGARGANGAILVTTKGAKEGKISVNYSGYAKFNTPTKYLEALGPYDYLAYKWGVTAAHGDAYRLPFEKLYGLGANAGSNTGGIDAYRDTPRFDMQKEAYKQSFSHNHDLTIAGGNDKTKVMFSVNYTDEQGMKINSFFKRVNSNLKISQKISDRLEFGMDTRYVDIQNMSSEGTVSGSGSILSSAYRFRPIALEDIKGDLSALESGNIEQYAKNSMWDLYGPAVRLADYEPLTIRQSLRSTANLNWSIIDNLNFRTELTLGRAWNQSKIWQGAMYMGGDYFDTFTQEIMYAGDADYRKSDKWNMRWSNTLNYDISINDKNRLNILVGQEVTDSGGSEMRVQSTYFPANFTKDNAFAMINQNDKDKGRSQTSSSIDTPDRILSFFSRVNYSLMDKYLLTVTFRGDGSSKFSPEHRWGYFPAAALAWRVSEESFMDNTSSWLDNLKLRLSYGEVGNDGISSNLWSQMWKSETDGRLQNVLNNVLQPSYNLTSSQMANPKLKWETTITRDLGLDFTLWGGKLNGTLDLYWNTTKDLLMLTSNPAITGFTTTYANIGQTSNKGVELSLDGTVYRNKDWNISVGGNINFNRGSIDELAENVTGLYGTAWASSSLYPSSDYILKVGQPVGLVRGLISDGFYTTDDFIYANGKYTLKDGVADVTNSVIPVLHGIGTNERPTGQIAYPGAPKFRDISGPNGAPDGKIDDNDVTVIGNTAPKHTGGFNINAGYKNFDFGMYFNWSYGNDVYNANMLASLYNYKEAGVYENKLSVLKDSYKIYDIVNGQLKRLSTPEELNAANVNAKLPLAYHENGITSSLGVEDGSFLRLNTVTLGYTLPSSLTKSLGISSLRVYGNIYNLMTFTAYKGLDPEVNANPDQNKQAYPTLGLDWGTYPRARSFVVGVNLSF